MLPAQIVTTTCSFSVFKSDPHFPDGFKWAQRGDPQYIGTSKKECLNCRFNSEGGHRKQATIIWTARCSSTPQRSGLLGQRMLQERPCGAANWQ